MTTPDAELAYRVLDHIDAHPEQWNQGVYIGKTDCGTVACFAGWACLLSGDEPYWMDRRVTDYVRVDGFLTVRERARNLLRSECWADMGDDQNEEDLFAPYHNREDLGRLVRVLFGPRSGETS